MEDDSPHTAPTVEDLDARLTALEAKVVTMQAYMDTEYGLRAPVPPSEPSD